MSGLKLAAIYSYPPARLGFCGWKIKKTPIILESFIKGEKISSDKVKKILRGFEASYPYYQLIAQANGIDNPFDQKVIKAYWLGSKLLDKVRLTDLKRLILNDFTKPGCLTKKEAPRKVAAIPLGAKPHHSFHVLILGSITGRVKLAGKLFDLCRVSWGKVTEIRNQKLKVVYQPLMIKKDKFYLVDPVEKEIIWHKDFLPRVSLGQTISFHWDRACQVLNKKEQGNLLKYTQLTLKLVNARHK